MHIKELYIVSLDSDTRVFMGEYNRNLKSGVVLVYILDKYYHENIDESQIIYGAYGKPSLKNNKYHFNVSNSASKLVIVISLNIVGIDIQKIKEKVFLDEYFNKNELKLAHELVGEIRGNILLWTIKESYTKLLGVGTVKAFEEIVIHCLKPITIIDSQRLDNSDVIFFSINIENEYILTICKEKGSFN